MSNFALDVNTPQGDIISSLNYVLANLGTFDGNIVANIANTAIVSANVVTANTITGQLSSVHTGTIGYLRGYVNVKYSTSSTGGTGFSANSTNATYYGVDNTTSGTISSNPADYNWTQVAGGGFGTTKGLYYTTLGGGQIYFAVGTTASSSRYQPVLDDTPIQLQNLANSLVQTENIQPGAVTNVAIAANTITAENVQPNTLTALQLADRTLGEAQIALQGITGNVIAQNTITGNLVALNTITGNLVVPGTITGNLVAANTITADNITVGTITADLLAANLIIAKDIVSIGATLGNNSSTGYWMQANTGSARFGGNINIGNNLTIGNNATIGGNLVVSGLITSGSLNSNTVSTTVIQQNAVTDTLAVGTGTVYTEPGRQLAYVGYDSSTGYYYWADSSYVSMPYSSNLITTTSNVVNTVSGQITVGGYITANVTFGGYVDAVISKYSYSTGIISVLAGTVGSKTIPFSIYPAGSLLPLTEYVFPQTIQTITNYGYTANTVPESTRYAWLYKASAITTTYPANVYVFYSNVSSQSLNITNLKR